MTQTIGATGPIRLTAIAPQPWKNGGGVTRPLASGPGWRVSLADVACSGPFSVFPGILRHSIVLAGGPLRLKSDDAALELVPHALASYAGAIAWECLLEGPAATVLNVMCEPGKATVDVQLVRRAWLDPRPVSSTLVLPVHASASVAVDDGAKLLVPRDSYILHGGPGTLNCEVSQSDGDGPAYLVVLRLQSITRSYAEMNPR